MMRTFLCFLTMLLLLLSSCTGSGMDKDRKVLAEVGDEYVYLDEALQGMPEGLSSKDSILYVRQFVKNRVRDLLVYGKAVKNIPQSQELEDLVENYRRSLVIYEYQQQVLNEKMQTEISETELMDFYKKNSRRFAAERNLVKGIFIKVPKNAPGLGKLRELYKSSSAESFEKIEKFCVQNAGQVEFFYDKWVSFDDIMDKIPYTISDRSEFLRTRSNLEVTENDFCYLLYIDDYVLAGNTAPFEYVRNTVQNVLMNTRKSQFLDQFEKNLMSEAERKNKVKYYK